jgi:hypothetical protein
MESDFKRALRDGPARYEARPAVLLPHELLTFDQLTGIEFLSDHRDDAYEEPGSEEDHHLAEAKLRDGQTVYSLCVVCDPGSHRIKRANNNEARAPDKRFQYLPDQYNPIIEKLVAEVKRQSGKNATQAEVLRRSAAEFKKLGMKVPGDTVLENRVKLFFKMK